jgi:hypothetical protein
MELIKAREVRLTRKNEQITAVLGFDSESYLLKNQAVPGAAIRRPPIPAIRIGTHAPVNSFGEIIK